MGIILRQLVLGPPRDMTDSEKIDQAREGAIPIGLMEPPVREPMAEILQRALEVEPARRYAEPSPRICRLLPPCARFPRSHSILAFGQAAPALAEEESEGEEKRS
ncbi:MAG: hypothetical protein IPG50_30915 [Myxococcales bacterium]|nr:hypothetical protein [Myxococcales bacterium]